MAKESGRKGKDEMNDLQTIYGTGAGVFGVSSLITGAIFIYFVWKGRVAKNSTMDHVHWLNSTWIYLLLATNFLLLAVLYATNAVGFGFYVKANLHVINVIRWLTIAVVGTLYQGCLAYILTNDHRTWNVKKKKTHLGAQNFFILFYYALSQIAIFFATITVNHNAHILCMVASLVTFIISILLYFFPDDKMSIDASKLKDYVFNTVSDKEVANKVRTLEESIISSYRITFMVLLGLSYVINFVIWFLSRSNDISDAISLQGEAIAYLVSDFLFFVPFASLLVGLTFYYKMKTIAIKNETTKEMRFKASEARSNQAYFGAKK